MLALGLYGSWFKTNEIEALWLQSRAVMMIDIMYDICTFTRHVAQALLITWPL